MSQIIDPRFVYSSMSLQTVDELFRHVGADLVAAGRVRHTFVAGLTERESAYPTGLPVSGGVAIPHTDAAHVLEDTIAVVMLDRPVLFHAMGGTDESIEVSTVFVLALTDPAQHLRLLPRIVRSIQQQEFVVGLHACTDPATLTDQVRRAFGIDHSPEMEPQASLPETAPSRLSQALNSTTETRALRFGPGAVAETGALFVEQFPGATALVVADENTYAAAGKQVMQSLQQAGVPLAAEPFVFPGTPTLYCSYDNVILVRNALSGLPGAVCCAVAAGTLNDIVKLAVGELGRPYLSICTAASVDGYTAFGASIAKDGFKITRECPAPTALVADTTLMADAPARLTATGYGDLIEKIPAGADWILADELGIEPIVDSVWNMVQPSSKAALEHPERLAAGDPQAFSDLAEANLLSGLSMQALRSSRSASGAGHLFSHVWEMEGHGANWEPPLSHGFKVGIGTIASSAVWQQTLTLDLSNLDVDRLVAQAPTAADIEARCRNLLMPRIAPAAIEQSLAKLVTGQRLRDRLETIQRKWPQIQRRCAAQLIGPDEVARRLRAVNAPQHPRLIGINPERLRATHYKAQLIRSRYTVLDLLSEVGQLEMVVTMVTGPDGYWGKHADLWPVGHPVSCS